MATTIQGTPETLQAWAAGFLADEMHAPATGPNDPRVQFLEAWAQHEGIFSTGDMTNPLAIENAEGLAASNWNVQGVKVFKSVAAGYQALHQYLINQGLTGLTAALSSQTSTIPQLTQALAQASWEGSSNPAAVAKSAAYATSVGVAAGLNPDAAAKLVGSLSTGGTTTGPDNEGTTAQPPLEGMNQEYSGADSYKGFDLSAIPSTMMAQVKQAIDAYTSTPGEEQKLMADIYKNYGNEAWLASVPEMRTLLVAGSYNDWEKDPAMFESLVQDTSWYKTTNASQEMWQQEYADSPARANTAISQASSRIETLASSMGVQLNSTQLATMAKKVAQNSIDVAGNYDETTFSQTTIQGMIAAQFNAATFLQNEATPIGTAPSSTAAASSEVGGTGMAATLYNQFTQIARNYYLPLTDQQIANAVQSAIQASPSGSETDAIANFTTQAQMQSQTLYPALAPLLGTTSSTGTDQNPYTALAGYRSLIASYTGYQGDPDTIDLTNPQWSWILSGKAPPTNNVASGITPNPNATASTASSATTSPTLPTYDAVQQYLMATPQYQTTDQAKEQGWQVGSAILKAFGYQS